MGKLRHLPSLLIAGFFLLFVLIPLANLSLTAVTGKTIPILDLLSQGRPGEIYKETAENLTAEYLRDLGAVSRYKKAAKNSLFLAFLVASLATLLALPISLALGRRAFFYPKVFESLTLLPIVTPAFLYAFAIILIFNKSFFNPFSVGGLVFAQVTAFVPLAVIVQAPSFSLYSASWTAVSKSLGAGSWMNALRVWLPLNLPTLMTSFILVALRSLADFVTPMILTSTRLRLLILEAYRDLAGSNWWPGAAALSLEIVVFALALLILEKRISKGQRSASQLPIQTALSERSPVAASYKLAMSLYGLIILSFPLITAGLILWQSIGSGHLSLASCAALLNSALAPLSNSLVLGGACVALSLAAALSLVKFFPAGPRTKSFLLMASTFAFAIPSTVYAIALVGVFNRPPLFIHFTPSLLIIAILATRFNYLLQVLERSQERLGLDWDQASRAFKASPLFAFRWASFPYLKGALVAGSLLVFISSLQDVAISVLIAPPRFYPMSLVIVRNLADGLFWEASALSVVLMALLLGVSSLGFRNLILSREAEV